MRKNLFLSLLFLFILSVNSSAEIYILNNGSSETEFITTDFNSIQYINAFLLGKALNMKMNYDIYTHRFVMTSKDGKQAVFLAGYDTILFNNSPIKVSNPPVVSGLNFLLPVFFVEQKLASLLNFQFTRAKQGTIEDISEYLEDSSIQSDSTGDFELERKLIESESELSLADQNAEQEPEQQLPLAQDVSETAETEYLVQDEQVIGSSEKIETQVTESAPSATETVAVTDDFQLSSEAPQPPPQYIVSGKVIVLDPGPGEDIPTNDENILNQVALEKKICFEFCNQLKSAIENMLGIQTILTRQFATGESPSIDERVNIANKYSAKLFISIRTGAHFSSDIKGYSVYYLSELADDLPPDAKISSLKNSIWDFAYLKSVENSEQIARSIYDNLVKILDFEGRGCRQSRLFAFRALNMPSVMIELGLMSSSQDRLRLQNPQYQKQIIWAIISAIKPFVTEN